jgi:hypothetical protein
MIPIGWKCLSTPSTFIVIPPEGTSITAISERLSLLYSSPLAFKSYSIASLSSLSDINITVGLLGI